MKIGVFEMSFEQYQAEHGVNQSSLKLLARSPAHMRFLLDHPKPPTPAQILGQVLDTAVFDPDKLKDSFHVRPSHYVTDKAERKPWHGGATFCKNWIETHKDRPIIPQEKMTNVLLMRDQVMKKKASALVLKEGKSGLCMFWEDMETGLQMKGRTDWMSGSTIPDLKSSVDAGSGWFSKAIANFGYDVQAAFYLDGAAALGLNKEHFLFIVAEKDPPFAVAVYELDADSIAIGRQKYRRLLTQYLECVVANVWPAYSDNIEMISTPLWAKRKEFNQFESEPALEVEA